MREAKKRKVHTAEFKAKVGLEALRGLVEASDLPLSHLVEAACTRHPFYGSRRMVAFLKRVSHTANRKRVQRLRLAGMARAQYQPCAP